MDVDASAVRRLLFWNQFWLGLLLASAVLGVSLWFLSNSLQSQHQLRVRWSNDGDLRLSSFSDGPFVVTHLILGGREGENEGKKAVAELPKPVAIIDSRGASVSPEQLSKLTWRDISGQPVSPPGEGAPIRALYYRPLSTAPAGP